MLINMASGGHEDPIKAHVFAAEPCSDSQKSILNSCDDPKVSEDSKCVRMNRMQMGIT